MSSLFKLLIALAAGACAMTAAHADFLRPSAAGAPLMSYAENGLHTAAQPNSYRLGSQPRATEIVMQAMGALDTPYRLGGTSAATGFDCSGFVRVMVEEAVGLKLPRTAAEQAAATHRIDKADLRPGDLVFFNTRRRNYSHVGIYLGEGKFIHAPRTGAKVRVENMGVKYWQTRFNGARRVLHADAPQAGADTLAQRPVLDTRMVSETAPEAAPVAATSQAAASLPALPQAAAATATVAAAQGAPASQNARKLAQQHSSAKKVQTASAGTAAKRASAKVAAKAAKTGKATKVARADKTVKVKAGKPGKQVKTAAKAVQTAKAGAAKKKTQVAKTVNALAGKKSAAAKPVAVARRG